jgi:hypothetical protein
MANRRFWKLVGGLSCVLLVGAGCGGGGDDADDDGGTGETPVAGTPDPPPGDGDDGSAAAGGEVPDPCTLLTSAELSGLLGTDPGAGTTQGPVPDQRKICLFGSGVILAVEVAANWDGSLQLIRDQIGPDAIEEVPGVAAEAWWQAQGAQFLALGEEYFVGVTGPDRAAGQAVAEAMLAAL